MMSPMLAELGSEGMIPFFDHHHVAEKKIDGIRGTIEKGRLLTRDGVDITERFPEFVGIEKLEGIWDGEILCVSGSHGDTQSRVHVKDKFARKLLSKKFPAVFHVFDYLRDENDVRELVVRKTRMILDIETDSMIDVPLWMKRVEWSNDIPKLWLQAHAEEWEGIVVKNLESFYEPGKRSSSWIKIKRFLECEAVFVKFEEHPKGLTMETVDGKRVSVSGHQSSTVREKFRKGEEVKAYIQYMPSVQEGSKEWRFPSFRGLAE